MVDQAFNLRFVAEIEKHPELYNFNLRENTAKRSLKRNESWEAVAQAVNLSADECKQKWRHLRNVMGRNMKPQAPGCYKRPYYLAEAMAFAAPYIKSYDRSINYAENDSPQTIEVLSLPFDNDIMQEAANHHQVIIKEQQMDSSAENERVDTPELIFKPSRERNLVIEEEDSSMDAKRAARCTKIDLKGKRTFLLSLLPEIVPMTDDQMKAFRRRVLYLIDEIMTS